MAIVSVFALGVGVVDNQADASLRTAFGAFCGPLKHLQVAVRIAKGEYRVPPDEPVDANRLAGTIVNELDLSLFEKQGLAVIPFVFDDAAAANDLLRRDAVSALDPGSHELNAAARDDKRLESVRSK